MVSAAVRGCMETQFLKWPVDRGGQSADAILKPAQNSAPNQTRDMYSLLKAQTVHRLTDKIIYDKTM